MITHNHPIASSVLAEMRGTPKAGKNVDVPVISNVHSFHSHSGAAQAGSAAVLDVVKG